VISVFSSCDKHDHDHKHGTVTITKFSPADNQKFAETDTIWLRINLKSSEGDIHDYSIEVKNLNTNALVYNYQGHSHKNDLTTALWFIQSVDTNSNMELKVTTKDHDGNVGSQLVSNFTILNTSKFDDATINLISPNINSELENNSTNPLKIDVSHRLGLKSMSYNVKNEANNQIILEKSFDNLNLVKNFSIDSVFDIKITDHTDISINVNATDSLDHKTFRSYSFHVHP
jgi:hypothetical protein